MALLVLAFSAAVAGGSSRAEMVNPQQHVNNATRVTTEKTGDTEGSLAYLNLQNIKVHVQHTISQASFSALPFESRKLLRIDGHARTRAILLHVRRNYSLLDSSSVFIPGTNQGIIRARRDVARRHAMVCKCHRGDRGGVRTPQGRAEGKKEPNRRLVIPRVVLSLVPLRTCAFKINTNPSS